MRMNATVQSSGLYMLMRLNSVLQSSVTYFNENEFSHASLLCIILVCVPAFTFIRYTLIRIWIASFASEPIHNCICSECKVKFSWYFLINVLWDLFRHLNLFKGNNSSFSDTLISCVVSLRLLKVSFECKGKVYTLIITMTNHCFELLQWYLHIIERTTKRAKITSRNHG